MKSFLSLTEAANIEIIHFDVARRSSKDVYKFFTHSPDFTAPDDFGSK